MPKYLIKVRHGITTGTSTKTATVEANDKNHAYRMLMADGNVGPFMDWEEDFDYERGFYEAKLPDEGFSDPDQMREAKMTPAKVQKAQKELVATVQLLKKNFPQVLPIRKRDRSHAQGTVNWKLQCSTACRFGSVLYLGCDKRTTATNIRLFQKLLG